MIAEFVPTSKIVHRPRYARTGVKNHGWGHRSPKSPDRMVIGDSKRLLSRRDFPWEPAHRVDVAHPSDGNCNWL